MEQEFGSLFHFDDNFRCNDDGLFTWTSSEQKRVEDLVRDAGQMLNGETPQVGLFRDAHVQFLRHGLSSLMRGYETLDASRPWLVYWILHSLSLLKEPLPEESADKIVEFLKTCRAPSGGYGGGPGQDGHLATTYASVLALCIVGTKSAYQSMDRQQLHSFLLSLKEPDGGFCLHSGGETDIRGVYCALSVAVLINILTQELVENAAEWTISCQTYEGGFGASAGEEAHGGYTFCGLAILTLLGRTQLLHLPSLLRWLVFKQMRFEGGFQGRTNKLVDVCYSFWQAASFPLLYPLISQPDKPESEGWLFDSAGLTNYILNCCQHPQGGLFDKPGKKPDYYHTCYGLSGLCVAAFQDGNRLRETHPEWSLAPTHPVFNIALDKEEQARNYFKSQPAIK